MNSNTQRWVHYEMENTSTRTDEVNNITIKVLDTFTGELVGTARMKSFDNIWVELPEVEGRYRLRKPAVKRLDEKMIRNMSDLMHYKWLVSDGQWILKNMVKVKA